MSQVFVDTPGSVQRDLATKVDGLIDLPPVRPSQLADSAEHAEIAEVAYLFWEERGRPSGTAEADWLEAEQMVRERVNFG